MQGANQTVSLGEGEKLIINAIIVHVTSSSPKSLHLEKELERGGGRCSVGLGRCNCQPKLPRVFQVLLPTCNEADGERDG